MGGSQSRERGRGVPRNGGEEAAGHREKQVVKELEASRREVKEVKEEKQALAKELAAARAEVEAVRVELEAERLAAARVREDYDRHVATMIQVDALPVTCI